MTTVRVTSPRRPLGGRSLTLHAPSLGEPGQGVVDALIDLDALTREARPVAIRTLTGNADLGDAVLARRRLDRGDLRAERAPGFLGGHEAIRLERDKEVSVLLRVAGPAAEHAERVRRERQRKALVAAER